MRRTLSRPASWPISLKIPLVVAFLMLAIGSFVTERVLAKLSDIQDENLKELSGAYLDGLSSLVLPHVLRDDIWEVFDAIERSRAQYERISVLSTIVVDAQGDIIAASDPVVFPSGTKIQGSYQDTVIPENRLEIMADQPQVRIFRPIVFQDRTIGKLIVALDVAPQLAERGEIARTLIGISAAFTLFLAGFGYLVVRRMTRPMQVLTEHLDQSLDGQFLEITAPELSESSTEAATLFESYNSMVRAKNERDQLAASLHEEEKLAGLGRLAAAMAHEINNPLGGMLTALDTLKRHGDNPDIKIKTLGLLERGLKSIGDVVQSSLMAYRSRSEKRLLRGRDFSDLRHLLRPQISRRAQKLVWDMDWNGEVPLDGTAVRQIGLNLLLNASSAAGQGGRISFYSSISETGLTMIIENDGAGIPNDLLHCLNTKGEKKIPLEDSTGIGLWVICRLVDEMNGQIKAISSEDRARVTVMLPFGLGEAQNAA